MNRDTTDVIAAAWAKELPGVVGAELELGKRAARLSTLLNQQAETELARRGLTKAEYEVLAVLRASGAPYRLRPSDISQRLLLSSGGTSNLIRRLTAVGLIDRVPHPGDARGSWITLTGSGVVLAGEMVSAVSQAQRAVLQRISPETMQAAIDALRTVLVALGDTVP